MIQLDKQPEENSPDRQEINQLQISGQIISRVRIYSSGKMVFTLSNPAGRFYVQWLYPHWQPHLGQKVLVRGSIYSFTTEQGNSARVQADEIILLNVGNSSWPMLKN